MAVARSAIISRFFPTARYGSRPSLLEGAIVIGMSALSISPIGGICLLSSSSKEPPETLIIAGAVPRETSRLFGEAVSFLGRELGLCHAWARLGGARPGRRDAV